eukprot:MONOS_436.1-p1 / transcript=MONOS_436.1 / gene=MONOS_436 / organism=Monocercomonoides_exilis_PA203 / gene_product=Nek2A / transcript_product=Nek2A / location=Mono_scaffold00007:75175-82654(+) / protein_length=1876 / sequence_SO=supercontig / SO=protein_coding / is_pseudo=false
MTSAFEEYTVEKVLGAGAFGEVSLVRHKPTGGQYVWKKMPVEGGRLTAEQEAELFVAKTLDCDYVVKIKESIFHPTSDNKLELYLVMEYCGGGDLRGVITKKKAEGGKLSEEEIKDYFCQSLLGLHYLHSRNMLHRDIKPDNILLTSDHKLKLGDLGLLKEMKVDEKITTQAGTPAYMSPEIRGRQSYGSKADIFALGVVLYELCCLERPFDTTNMMELLFGVKVDVKAKEPVGYSEELIQLIMQMLHNDSEMRPSTDMLIEKPLIKEHIAKRGYVIPKTSSGNVTALDPTKMQALMEENAKLQQKVQEMEKKTDSSKAKGALPAELLAALLGGFGRADDEDEEKEKGDKEKKKKLKDIKARKDKEDGSDSEEDDEVLDFTSSFSTSDESEPMDYVDTPTTTEDSSSSSSSSDDSSSSSEKEDENSNDEQLDDDTKKKKRKEKKAAKEREQGVAILAEVSPSTRLKKWIEDDKGVVIVESNKAFCKWGKSTGETMMVRKKIATGVWRIELKFHSMYQVTSPTMKMVPFLKPILRDNEKFHEAHKSGMVEDEFVWIPQVGLCGVPRHVSRKYPFGIDKMSRCFTSEGDVFAERKATEGNAKWKEGDVIGMEVDMSKRCCYFFVNGERQKVFIKKIPGCVRFGVGMSKEGSRVEIVKLDRVAESSFVPRDDDVALPWRGSIEEEQKEEKREKEVEVMVQKMKEKRKGGGGEGGGKTEETAFLPLPIDGIVVKNKTVLWKARIPTMIYARGCVTEGIYRIDFRVKHGKDGVWCPVIGAACVPRLNPPTTCFGHDSASVSYYSQGACWVNNKAIAGNDTWKDGDVVGMEVNMKARRLCFFVNGKRQKLFIKGIPNPIQFGVGLGQDGAEADLIKFEKLKKGKFKPSSDDQPVRWVLDGSSGSGGDDSDDDTDSSDADAADISDDDSDDDLYAAFDDPDDDEDVLVLKDVALWLSPMPQMLLSRCFVMPNAQVVRVVVQMKMGERMGMWCPVVGVCEYPRLKSSRTCFGNDDESVAWYSNGRVVKSGIKKDGCEPWGDNDRLMIEVDMRNRRIYFFRNMRRQPVYMTNIPNLLQIGIGMSSEGAVAQIVSVVETTTSLFTPRANDRPFSWNPMLPLLADLEMAGRALAAVVAGAGSGGSGAAKGSTPLLRQPPPYAASGSSSLAKPCSGKPDVIQASFVQTVDYVRVAGKTVTWHNSKFAMVFVKQVITSGIWKATFQFKDTYSSRWNAMVAIFRSPWTRSVTNPMGLNDDSMVYMTNGQVVHDEELCFRGFSWGDKDRMTIEVNMDTRKAFFFGNDEKRPFFLSNLPDCIQLAVGCANAGAVVSLLSLERLPRSITIPHISDVIVVWQGQTKSDGEMLFRMLGVLPDDSSSSSSGSDSDKKNSAGDGGMLGSVLEKGTSFMACSHPKFEVYPHKVKAKTQEGRTVVNEKVLTEGIWRVDFKFQGACGQGKTAISYNQGFWEPTVGVCRAGWLEEEGDRSSLGNDPDSFDYHSYFGTCFCNGLEINGNTPWTDNDFITLEIDMNLHTVCIAVNDKRQPVCFVDIPRAVQVAIGLGKDYGTCTIEAFGQLSEPFLNPPTEKDTLCNMRLNSLVEYGKDYEAQVKLYPRFVSDPNCTVYAVDPSGYVGRWFQDVGRMLFLDRVFNYGDGAFRADFMFHNTEGGRMNANIGITAVPKGPESDFRFGDDPDSVAYYQSGNIFHAAEKKEGCAVWKDGDVISLLVDMKQRRLFFLKNNQRQNTFVMSLPLSVQIGVGLGKAGGAVELVRFVQLYNPEQEEVVLQEKSSEMRGVFWAGRHEEMTWGMSPFREVSVEGKIVRWVEQKPCVMLGRWIINEGIWRFDVKITNACIGGEWTPVIGLSRCPWTQTPLNCFGQDRDSCAFYML